MTATAVRTSRLDVSAMRALIDGGPAVRLVDVRTPGEFAARRIPGSINVPLDVVRTRASGRRARHDDTVVLVCASGTRADQAHELLADAGLAHVGVLDGGVGAWDGAGEEIEQGRGAWAMERQVRLTAGTLVLSGVLASLRYRPAVALAGAIGAGLTFSAVTDTCGMARVLSALAHNRAGAPDPSSALAALLD